MEKKDGIMPASWSVEELDADWSSLPPGRI